MQLLQQCTQGRLHIWLQNIVNQKKQAEEEAQQAMDAGKPTKASGLPQPTAPAAPVGGKRRNRWDQSTTAE